MNKPFAIYIASPEVLPIVEMLFPPIKEYDYLTELHKHYIVFNLPEKGNTRIIDRNTFYELDGFEDRTRVSISS